jgi:hypothetical protein
MPSNELVLGIHTSRRLGALYYSIIANLQINITLYSKMTDKLINDCVSKTEMILR